MGTADRRERLTESLAALGFLAAASAMALQLPSAPVPVATAAWLVGLLCVLHRVEFDVGEGRTRPIQLVLVPMLLLLPPAAVPLLVAAAFVCARLPGVAAGKERAVAVPLALADGWFCLAPALVLALAGLPDDLWAAGLVVGLAVAGQIVLDLVTASLRLRIGLGVHVRELLAGFAWVYLVDVLLTPIGVLAAVVGRDTPLAVAAILPLASLLAIFARERRGRIENALEVNRLVSESEQRLQSIVQNSSDLILIVGRDGAIEKLTGAVAGVFGDDPDAAVGTSLLDHVHPDDAALVRAFLDRVAVDGASAGQALDWRLRRADGSHRYVETVATNLLGDERLEGIVLTARDVEDRKAFEEQLRHRAFHDPLTQLANRGLFYDRIEHALSAQTRTEHRVGVLFLDLDDFKVINDVHGHAAGDELLVGVAHRLRECLRSADTAARLGGDEFGVLIEGVAGTNEPVQAAERILAAFTEPIDVQGQRLLVTPSIGITVSRPGDPNVDELLRQADLAMYAAKRHGKRRWELYDDALERSAAPGAEADATTWFQRGAEQREAILALLRRPDAINTVFQPVLDLRTGLVSGYEALARFAAAESRPPNAWFAQAHRVGLGFELEARAVATALAASGRPAGTYLTLNLSPSALTSQPVQDVLPERLDGLVIEITENELAADDPGFDAALADIRARGGRVAVDDAGAGYAGLKHVMRVAPDLIKLDRSLVAGVHEDPARAALISAFVRFARDSDATVCAEGIEELDELTRLADLDVTYGQGYVIARPGADWPAAAPEAAAACAASFTVTLTGDGGPLAGDAREQALEAIVALVAGAAGHAELAAARALIAAELRADQVTLLRRAPGTDELHLVRTGRASGAIVAGRSLHAVLQDRRVEQILASDPQADTREIATLAALGFRSVLRLPLTCEDRVVGVLEAYSEGDRPWSRFELRRARIVAHQLGAALERIERRAEPAYSRY